MPAARCAARFSRDVTTRLRRSPIGTFPGVAQVVRPDTEFSQRTTTAASRKCTITNRSPSGWLQAVHLPASRRMPVGRGTRLNGVLAELRHGAPPVPPSAARRA